MSWLDIKALKEKHDTLVQKAEEVFSLAKSEDRPLTEEESNKIDSFHNEAYSVEKEIVRQEAHNRLNKSLEEIVKVAQKDDKFELRKSLQTFAITSGTSTSGAELMKVLIPDFINQVQRSAAPVWEMGFKMANVAVGGSFPVPTSTASTQSAIIAEGSAITPTNQTTGNKDCQDYAYSKITTVLEQALQDSAFNLEEWLRQDFVNDISYKFSVDATTGDGSGKPEGFVTASAAGKTAASATAVTLDEVYDLLYSIDPMYHPNAVLSMHPSIWVYLLQLEDSNGQKLLQNGNYINGTERQFHGFKVVLNTAMDSAVTASKKIMCITQPSYGVVKVVDGGFNMRILNEIYQASNSVGFKMMSRLGFCHTNTAANKHLITAAS